MEVKETYVADETAFDVTLGARTRTALSEALMALPAVKLALLAAIEASGGDPDAQWSLDVRDAAIAWRGPAAPAPDGGARANRDDR